MSNDIRFYAERKAFRENGHEPGTYTFDEQGVFSNLPGIVKQQAVENFKPKQPSSASSSLTHDI